MIIIITGTPCTGKTTLAKIIAKELKFKRINTNKIIKENNLLENKDEVDVNKLSKVLEKMIKTSKQNLVIDSHMSHYLDPKYVDLCIITTCKLKTLKERLTKRRYSKAKIDNNMECEIMEVCKIEAEESNHKVTTINPSIKKEVKEFLRKIKSIINS
jgi:adenylate kinase